MTMSVRATQDVNSEDFDYLCKSCNQKLFKGNDIVHNYLKGFAGMTLCNAVYIKYQNWMGYMKTNMGKLFCPNSKCSSVLGFCNQQGGKCHCGTRIDKMYLIYPLRITYIKVKPNLKNE